MKMTVALIVLCGFGAQVLAADAQAPGGLLVSPGEVAAVEARVMKRVREYQEMSCVRPVLRGTAEPGSGVDELAAFGEGSGDLHPCFGLLEEHREALAPDDFDRFVETGEGIPGDLLGTLGEACALIPGRGSAAVAHGDVCSPWRPGVRGNPSFMPLIRSSKLSVILGRTTYRPEDALALARIALDRIRLDQDTCRGGGTLITAMIAVASTVRFQAPWLRWLLGRGDLSEAGYAEVADSLGILAATEPPIGGVIEADGFWSFLQVLLPILKGPDWTPPGGWDDGHIAVTPEDTNGPFGGKNFIDKETDSAILVIAMDEVQRAQSAACPVDSTVMECTTGLRRHAAEVLARNEVGIVIRVIRIIGAPDPRRAIRQAIVDILMGVATPAFDKYVEKYALRALRIAALRIHASVLREWAETGVCREGFGQPHWNELTRDPVFGGALSVTLDSATGELVIRTTGTFQTPTVSDEVEYRFTCPPPPAS